MPVPFEFLLNDDDFQIVSKVHSKIGHNGSISKAAVEIVKCYYRSLNPKVIFDKGIQGSDIKITIDGSSECFEIKGTEKDDIDWTSLRVSSNQSHDLLVGGLRIIRVCGVGQRLVQLYYLQHGRDFTLVEEPRWRIQRL